MSAPANRILAALLAAGASLTLAAPARAGFWDQIFGVAPRPVYAPAQIDNPLNVTVRPRHKKDAGLPKAPKDEAPMKRVYPIEYAKDPYWYTRDETLKKGDIIVLNNRVVVFDGGDRRGANFTAFLASRLLSAKAKSHLKYLVSTPKDNHTVWEPVATIRARNIEAANEASLKLSR